MKLNMKLLDRVRLIKDVQGQEHQLHTLKTDTM